MINKNSFNVNIIKCFLNPCHLIAYICIYICINDKEDIIKPQIVYQQITRDSIKRIKAVFIIIQS